MKTFSKPRGSPTPSKKRRAKRRVVKASPLSYYAGPLIDCEEALDSALAALGAIDSVNIATMLQTSGRPPLRKREAGFEGLVWIIISQQVSVASANAIFARFKAEFGACEGAHILAASDERLKSCGLSSPKIRALRALAEALVSRSLDLENLAVLPAEEAHGALIEVKGIGPWTADIFLLFCLGHPDAWPAGDLALQEAAKLLLGLKTRPDAKKLEKLGQNWRPWRGVAARLLWAYYGAMKNGRAGMAMAAP